jgi:hypothetical protein
MPFLGFTSVVSLKAFGMLLASGVHRNVRRRDMKDQSGSHDPGRILAHASLYLWKYWRQYALTAWEDAESILRQAYQTVEHEDRIEFMRALDESAA